MSTILAKKVTLFYYYVVSMRDTKSSSRSQPHFGYSYCEEQLSIKAVSRLLVGIYLITNRSSTGYQKLTNSLKIQQAQVWSCDKRNNYCVFIMPTMFPLLKLYFDLWFKSTCNSWISHFGFKFNVWWNTFHHSAASKIFEGLEMLPTMPW